MARNLLVVDDSSTIRDAVRYALAGEDWTVATAADAAEAQEALRQGAFDAVLCDTSLAPDDGYEACRALRRAMGEKPVPIVLMGGKVSENLAASAGAMAVLTKPFESDELLEVLRSGIERGSFDLAVEDFAPLSEEELYEPVRPAPAETVSIATEEVEIIDLSDDEDVEDLELLQDLQPLGTGPAAATEGSEPAPGEWDLQGLVRTLDLEDLAGPDEIPERSQQTGPVEFDLGDLEGEEAEPESPSLGGMTFSEGPTAPVRSSARAEGDELEEFDLDDLDLDLDLAPQPPPATAELPAAASPIAPQGTADLEAPTEFDDLLQDVDLEGWAEEGADAGEVPAPTGEAVPTEPTGVEPEAIELEPAPEDERELAWEGVGEAGEAAGQEASEPETFGGGEAFPATALATAGATGEPEMAAAAEPETEAPAEAGEAPVETLPEPLETDATWAEASPTPTHAVAWDQEMPSADGLAEPVARAAEQAVREALTKSLSPEALTPVIEAVVERAVWAVVPELAERLIREAIERLQQDPVVD
jgi:two-component system chemotaxis response regulator CheY